jgi:hypothetical protein
MAEGMASKKKKKKKAGCLMVARKGEGGAGKEGRRERERVSIS